MNSHRPPQTVLIGARPQSAAASSEPDPPLRLRRVVPPGVRADEERAEAAMRQTPPPRLALMEAEGATRGACHMLGDVTFLGRGVDNDIVSPVLDVSRRHAEVRLEKRHYVIRDVGSMMGTLLNGKPLKQGTPLTPGDRLQLASWHLEVVRAPDIVAPPPPPPPQSAVSWSRCPACETAVPPNAAFCGTCGGRLQ